MRGLVYKDLYLIKNKLLMSVGAIIFIIVITYVLFATAGSAAISQVEMSVFLGALMMDAVIVLYMASVNYDFVIKADSERKWSFYGMSIPGSIKTVVAAKYMTVFILHFVAFTLCVINDIFLGLIFGKAVNSTMFALVCVLFSLLIISVEMPLGFRFGADKASKIRILITAVIILIIAIYLLFGNIEWLMAEDGTFKTLLRIFTEGGLNAVSGELERMIEKMAYESIIISALAVHFIVLLYYISYRVSCKVFRKGALRDDN